MTLLLILFGDDPHNVGTFHGQKRRMENNLSIRALDIDISDGQELLIRVQFILDALVSANMDLAMHEVCRGLDDSLYRYLGNNICKDLALFIIFNRHIASI